MTPEKIESLKEEILRAEEDANEDALDPNCYGAGYDQGYLDGLRQAKMILLDEED